MGWLTDYTNAGMVSHLAETEKIRWAAEPQPEGVS
jgi:hypothetical protein